MEINLEPKQSLAFLTPATEVLYGGAKGGGKSFLMRASALRWAMEVPGIQVYLFRRTLADLRRNHLEGPKSFPVMLKEHLDSGHVKYHDKDKQYSFWNGSNINLCYCESERDVENYQGAEIHVLMPDEATHYTEYQYRYLRGQVRLAGLKVPEQYKGRLPRIEAGANPGSVGHAWVKRTFINPKPPLEMWRADASEGGMLRQFIPARLSDNPHLTADDPEYADRLRGMGSDDLVRAMLEGDWDIIAGQAFEKLRREIHCIDPFTPPDDWLCFGSLDWGSSAPFSFGLWAVSNGNALPDGRTYRRGAMLRYNELYGWSGKPNEGQRKEATEVADAIKARINGRRLAYIAADPSMWKVDGGPSIAETMLRRGIVLRKADHNRLTGYVEVRQRIAGDGDGPMLYATRNCHDGFWRTMPDIVMDKSHIEDVDTDSEDHCYDECFVAGTMIQCASGLKPIESLRVGDCVETRFGAHPVEAVFSLGNRHVFDVLFSDGSSIRGTANHPVWVDGVGFRPLVTLRYADIMRPWTIPINTETLRARNGGDYAARFRRAMLFTIETAIQRITESKTWNACQPKNIVSTIWRFCRDTFLRVSDAARNSGQSFPPHASVQINANRHGVGMLAWMTKNESAEAAASRFSLTAIQSKGIAAKSVLAVENISDQRPSIFARIARLSSRPKTLGPSGAPLHVVSVTPAGTQKVFNLTVANVPEYFAGGVLVHNCRYACVSRPWMQAPNRKVVKPDRWLMRFEQDDLESQNWKTA